MSESFDPAAFAAATGPLLGLSPEPASRESIIVHLKIAAELAGKLEAIELDDDAEPAPVFIP